MAFARPWRWLIVIAVLAVALTMLTKPVDAQSPPPLPSVISGSIVISGGGSVPDGLKLIARINEYESPSITVRDGGYKNLVIAPPSSDFTGKTVSFHLVLYGSDGETEIDSVEAAETIPFQSAYIKSGVTLTFSRIPVFPPTPTPTAIPTPTLTPTPLAAQPAIFSGFIVVVGGMVPEDARLTAHVGDYESDPAFIVGDEFKNLVVDPVNPGFIGQTINFFLDGVESSTKVIFESGRSNRELDLIFTDMPEPSPTPAPIPTATAEPSPTPVPIPTATPEPSPTPVPIPTTTPEPSPTPVPIPTVEPSPTPTPTAGGFFGTCGSPQSGDVPIQAGVVNGLVLLAPLVLIWAYRRKRGSGG